jgi:hypothetical protein
MLIIMANSSSLSCTRVHHAYLDSYATSLLVNCIAQVFSIVPHARARVVRRLLGGVLDQSRSSAAQLAYLTAWEALLQQQAADDCTALEPHAGPVADALSALTLLQPQVSTMLTTFSSCVSSSSSCSADAH